MADISEFFREKSGQLSMSRLLSFLSFWPATYILIRLGTETALGIYVGAFVVNYFGGKIGEGRIQQRDSGGQ